MCFGEESRWVCRVSRLLVIVGFVVCSILLVLGCLVLRIVLLGRMIVIDLMV